MQTSEPLSQQDLDTLNALLSSKRMSAFLGMFIGPGFVLAGTIMLYMMWKEASTEMWFNIVGYLLIGFLVIGGTIRQYYKNKEQNIRPSHGQTKQVYTGMLTHTEVIKKKYVRYHFNGCTVDTRIAAGTGNFSRAFLHDRDIDNFITRTNIPVTLSVALLEPGVNIVLGIDYDQQHYAESIQPMDVEDKKIILRRARTSAAGCLICIVAFFTILFFVVSKFDLFTFFITLLLFIIPASLLIRYLYRTNSKNIEAAGNKFVINTIVNEMLTLSEETGDSSDVNYYLRLGNSVLADVTFNKTGKGKYTVGDEVVLEYMQTRKGRKGTLIDIRKV